MKTGKIQTTLQRCYFAVLSDKRDVQGRTRSFVQPSHTLLQLPIRNVLMVSRPDRMLQSIVHKTSLSYFTFRYVYFVLELFTCTQ